MQDMAGALGTDVSGYQAWEASSGPIPPLASRRVRWLHDDWQRAKAIEASGLPACDWADSWYETHLTLTDADALLESLAASEEHGRDCEVCQARIEYLAERFPPKKAYPTGGLRALLEGALVRVWKLPRRLRPAVFGAVILIVLTLPRVVVGLIAGPDRLQVLGAGLAAAGMAGMAGAAAGLAYSFIGAPLRRIGRPGDYLAGMVCVSAYFIALGVVAEPAFGEPLFDLREGASWFALVACALLFGSVVGHWWFRDLDR